MRQKYSHIQTLMLIVFDISFRREVMLTVLGLGSRHSIMLNRKTYSEIHLLFGDFLITIICVPTYFVRCTKVPYTSYLYFRPSHDLYLLHF